MALILYCRVCLEGIRHQGGELPSKCTRCATTDSRERGLWITRDELPDPKVDYALSANDKRFLRGIKIEG